MRVQNGSTRSIFYQILKTWQQPPQPSRTRNTSSACLAIMVMVRGELTVNTATRSGKGIKEGISMINFLIMMPIKSSTAPT